MNKCRSSKHEIDSKYILKYVPTVIFKLFFYLTKLLFSGQRRFKGDFVRG